MQYWSQHNLKMFCLYRPGRGCHIVLVRWWNQSYAFICAIDQNCILIGTRRIQNFTFVSALMHNLRIMGGHQEHNRHRPLQQCDYPAVSWPCWQDHPNAIHWSFSYLFPQRWLSCISCILPWLCCHDHSDLSHCFVFLLTLEISALRYSKKSVFKFFSIIASWFQLLLKIVLLIKSFW